MKVLIIGGGGREHALAVTYAKSKKVKRVVMTPGNGLTDFGPSTGSGFKIKNYPDVGMMDFDGIVQVCKKEKIDLVDVAQDDVIAAGYVDRLEKLGIKAFGPTQKASQLEWDKQWARNFMVKYGLPIPEFKSFTHQEEAVAYINSMPDKLLFIKAAGLALGKGVIKATNKKEAIKGVAQMSSFGKAGKTFLIEEGLVGEEFSLFTLCDRENYKVVSWAQDHKTAYDGDKGPNTGGMGSVAPAGVVTKQILSEVEEKIIKPLMAGMKKEGRPYKGVLYLGGMATKNGVKIIEFNCRWGDPEAEVILPSIQTDYVDIVEAVLAGKLSLYSSSEAKPSREVSSRQARTINSIELDGKIRVSIAGCSKGYPVNYSAVKGKEIFGLTEAMKLPEVTIFGAGIKREGKRFFANGGRIFYVVGEGKDIREARERAYRAMGKISIGGDNLHFRKDIGWRDVARMKQ